jgi:hypothetical protein
MAGPVGEKRWGVRTLVCTIRGLRAWGGKVPGK